MTSTGLACNLIILGAAVAPAPVGGLPLVGPAHPALAWTCPMGATLELYSPAVGFPSIGGHVLCGISCLSGQPWLDARPCLLLPGFPCVQLTEDTILPVPLCYAKSPSCANAYGAAPPWRVWTRVNGASRFFSLTVVPLTSSQFVSGKVVEGSLVCASARSFLVLSPSLCPHACRVCGEGRRGRCRGPVRRLPPGASLEGHGRPCRLPR